MELIEVSQRQFSHQSQAREGSENGAPSLAGSSSELRSSCQGGNEEIQNWKALSEHSQRPEVQLPEGMPQPRELKAAEGQADSPRSSQEGTMSPGGDWQLSRADETPQKLKWGPRGMQGEQLIIIPL